MTFSSFASLTLLQINIPSFASLSNFQENFTIQLSGVKQWTLRRGRVRHPMRGTTPHYCREASVVENQLKIARLSCMGGNGSLENSGSYGFEYNDNNTDGPEQTITLYPGDCFYFPSGMWHCVKTIEPGVSLNVSLMGTSYASLVSEALQHVLVGKDQRWREIVTSRPGDMDGSQRLQELMGGLSKIVDEFVSNGGAAHCLPPALCYPTLSAINAEKDLDREEVDEYDMLEEETESKDNVSAEINGDGSLSLMEDDVDMPLSEIIVNVDQFEGPSGWVCDKPSKTAKLFRNPLASLIAMSDVASCVPSRANTSESDDNSVEGGETAKKYILNVNFAGNEMCESHIRVVLETTESVELMDSYEKGDGCNDTVVPPDCLFYYGLFSWKDSARDVAME